MPKTEEKSNSIFLNNKEDFIFTISPKSGAISTNKATVASDKRKIKIFLNGMIYNNNADQLIEGFSSQGTDYIKQVEGSFVIFLMLGTHFYILTDIVNSKKAFYAFIDNEWFVSNNIDLLPKDKCHLSMDGIACYLANGVMLNDLTLFQEIRSAKRASITGFINSEITSHSYWEYKYKYSSTSISQQQYQNELKLLLIESVKRRVSPASKTALSLSAGYDSRGILGILHQEIKAANISCFSYAVSDHPGIDTDAMLSKGLAAQCGYPHQIIKSYRGNLINLIKDNAREGKCLSNFCEELDAWHHLALKKGFSDIFVGDQCFGRDDFMSETKEDIFENISIRGSSSIRGLKTFISKNIYDQMVQCLDKLIDDIYEKTDAIPNLHDKVDFLYLDQRISHVLMPWRENFASQAGFVHNPYLDGAVLEFMNKVPPQLRKKTILYKQTIKELLPGLYSIKRARSSGYQVNWQKELQKNKTLLISLVEGTDSRLDDIFSKQVILDILNRKNSMFQKMETFSIKALKHLGRRNKIAKIIINIFIGSRYNNNGLSTPLEKIKMRLLLIRIYLSPSSSDN